MPGARRSRRSPAPIRYAVVGLGHIAQAAVLPAFSNARRNSVLTALVSDDARKRKALGRAYRVPAAYSYEQYEQCLRDVDAVFITLPNSLHADYTIRAAKHGVHVLCEKPMAVTVQECVKMNRACDAAGVKLMIAYRLHFDPLHLETIDAARRGSLGTLKYVSANFSMRVKPGNIRTKPTLGGGTLYDIGIYCINAARYLFGSDPSEVLASSVNSGAAATRDIDESTAAILRFPRERLATFVTSFNAADVSTLRVVGTLGQVELDPAFEYAEGLSATFTIGGRANTRTAKRRDQFAAELLYFSDCILLDRVPEPSGREGLQDVAIIEALYESARAGRAVKVRPQPKDATPRPSQRIVRPPSRRKPLIHAEPGHQE